jgi:hypothetical protein
MADKYLLLSWKRLLLIAGAWIAAVVLHNAVYAVFYDYFSRTGGDEPFFFILAVIVIPLYLIIAVAYTGIRRLRKDGEQHV